jgi:vacuolar-type H+-ATPase subunit H
LERAEQHLDDWEVPVKSTSYIQEARDFWNQQRELRKHRNTQVAEARDKAEKLLSLTDTDLNDYGDRLEDDQRKKIGSQRDELKTVIDQEASENDLEKIQEGMNKLLDISGPLTIVIAEANKLLLKSAHEAIFAGEKDLLDGGFGQGASSPEMEQISAHVQKLKVLVMSPQDGWNRNDIKSAINDVTESRAKLQEKLAAEIEAQNPAAAQMEANEADAAVTDSETEPNTAVGDDAAANVVVVAPAPTLSTTMSVTSTSSHDASPTPLLPVGQGS